MAFGEMVFILLVCMCACFEIKTNVVIDPTTSVKVGRMLMNCQIDNQQKNRIRPANQKLSINFRGSIKKKQKLKSYLDLH